MGVHDRNVRVSGELNNVYQILANVLAVNRYEINGQNPPVQIAASKGSKVITLALGTADYEELNVTLIAADPGLVDVHFHFSFPWKSLLFLTPSERRKHEEGDRMVDEFVRLVGASRPRTSSGLQGIRTRVCVGCGAVNASNAEFCTSCGRSLSVSSGTAGRASVCPACSARLDGTEGFCPYCGHKLR